MIYNLYSSRKPTRDNIPKERKMDWKRSGSKFEVIQAPERKPNKTLWIIAIVIMVIVIIIAIILSLTPPASANTQQEAIIRHFVIETLCREHNDKMLKKVTPLVNSILLRSHEAGIDPFLTTAIAYEESKFNPLCTGAAGERGLMQIHPCHREWNRSLLRQIDYNIIAGLSVLNDHIRSAGSLNGGLRGYTGGRAGRYSRVWKQLKAEWEKENEI
jgi:soluble lytic murein transglycosylase-like protein